MNDSPDVLKTLDALIAALDSIIGDATEALYAVRTERIAEQSRRRQPHYAAMADETGAG